jgi:hypothetical protein
MFSSGSVAVTLGAGNSQCPPHTAQLAEQCFLDLASGVATTDDGSNHIRDNTGVIDGLDLQKGSRLGSKIDGEGKVGSGGGGGGIPMDYRRIREYCAP